MDSLAKKQSLKDIHSALEHLPRELDSMYLETVERIQSQDEDDVRLARQVLSWVSFAFRPLTLDEIRHAVTVEPWSPTFDQDALPFEEVVTDVCAGLITVGHESKVVSLIHYTAQEYFERTRTNWLPDVPGTLATTCLTYLSLDVFSEGPCNTDKGLYSRLQAYPFLRYASQYWGLHAAGDAEERIKDNIATFLKQKPKLSSSIQAMAAPEFRYENYSQRYRKDMPALQVAALFGLQAVARLLLDMGEDVNATAKDGRAALHRAAVNGWLAMVRLLVQHGASVDLRDDSGQSALHRAAAKGHGDVVQLLLENGSDVRAIDKGGQTALHRAVAHGGEAAILPLITGGAEIGARDWCVWTPLHLAALYGEDTAAALLLAHGADANAKDRHGRTALSQAATHGQRAIAQRLLDKGADIEALDEHECTPLQAAAARGQDDVVRLLLERGSRMNRPDKMHQTALHRAIAGGSETSTQLLLQNGADANQVDAYQWTALHMAAAKGSEPLIKLLLEHGANVNAVDKDGGSPLFWAAVFGQKSAGHLLLENGAKADEMNDWVDNLVRRERLNHAGYYFAPHPIDWHLQSARQEREIWQHREWDTATWQRTDTEPPPLQRKIFNGGQSVKQYLLSRRTPLTQRPWDEHEILERLLLGEQADVEAADNEGRTKLHRMVIRGNEAAVRVLIAVGANVAATNKKGETAVEAAVLRGYEHIVRVLLDNGAKVDAPRRSCSDTTLHTASRNGDERMVRLLVERGADIGACGPDLKTPLHLAAENDHTAIVRLLGKSVEMVNRTCTEGTALHIAVQRGHEPTIRQLLDLGANPCIPSRGRTTLCLAIGLKNLTATQLMLERGADVNAKDGWGSYPGVYLARQGWGALHLATSWDSKAMIELLLAHGADIMMRDHHEATALHYAAECGFETAARILLECGAEVNAQARYWNLLLVPLGRPADQDQRPAVMSLFLHKDANVKATALLHGARVCERGEEALTPLHLAAGIGDEGMVRLLLDNGAAIDATDTAGRTPFAYATKNSHVSVTRLLLERGAAPTQY